MDIRGRKMRKPPACVQCRKRKIGCDRVKPICGNCRKANKGDCFYPDVPGRYVPSSSSKSHDKNVGNLSNNFSTITHSKESTSILQHNPELASLEQIREYNTRLQLINQDQNRASPSPLEHAQFIPRATPNFENKPVSSANGSAPHLNWVQGPAIFDQMTAPYTQEEVILKEMNFLKGRLLELQEITGKKITGVNLSFNPITEKNEDGIDGNSSKKRKITNGSNDLLGYEMDFNNNIDEFKDLDPQFLDYTKVFSVFGSKNLPLPNFDDSPNAIFTNHFLTLRDNFSYSFRKAYSNVIKNNFESNLAQWQQEKMRNAYLFLSSSIIDGKNLSIKFPSRNTTQELITKFISIGKEITTLIPILKTRELFSSIEQSFGREPIFNPATLNIGQLITFGQISFCLLFAYESLASSVLIILKDEQLEAFKQLANFLPHLLNNVKLIKAELDKRKGSLQTIETLKFIALYKYYQTISSLSIASNEDKLNDYVDYDEDIHLALHLGINDEQKDEVNIQIWNFTYKNYCWRHFFRGEIPIMMSDQKLNSAPIIDTLLSSDFSFLSFQMELLQYLQSRDRVISLKKVLHAKEIFKSKFDAQTKRCSLSVFSAVSVNHVIDTIIYRRGMLYINYYLLLQYEILKDCKKFVEVYKDLLQHIQDTVFYIFSNLANKNMAGYEFLYVNKLFVSLGSICDILLALYQRSRFAFEANSPENEELTKENDTQASSIVMVIRKLLMLLEDYTKNCKVINPVIRSTIIRFQTIIAFTKITEKDDGDDSSLDDITKSKKVALIEDVKSTLQYAANGFESIDVDDFSKFNAKINNISESLIVSDFYHKREAFLPGSPETLGITPKNFNRIYNALE